MIDFLLMLLRLYYEFFKTGLFAIGGGMATIPFLEEMANSTGWFTSADLANMIAVGESTPGPIGVNMATYVGFISGQSGLAEYGPVMEILGGVLGAIVATLGLITPSIIIILIVAAMLKSFKDNKYVSSAFYGLRPASTGLIAAAGLSVLLANMFLREEGQSLAQSVFNWKGLILAIVLWVLTNLVKPTKKLHPIIFIGASAVIGVVFSM